MTVYATEADFKAAFSTAEFDQITAEFTNGFVLELENASRIIDSEISGRYSVPLALPCGGVINQICLDVTRWYLYDDSVPEAVQRRYENALKILEMIKNGSITLVGATPADIVVTPKAAAIATGSAQVFTDTYLDTLLP